MNKLAVCTLALAVACGAQAKNLKAEADLGHNLWWNAPERPVVKIAFTDTTGKKRDARVNFYVTADTAADVRLWERTATVRAPQTLEFELPVTAPGFYRCHVEDDGHEILSTCVGYEPTQVVSLPDAQPDFEAFWQRAKAELKQVPADYTLELLPELSGQKRNVYLCTFRSWGGGTIKAWVAIPKKPGKYPAQVYYNGYGGKPWRLDPDGRPDWIEMATSVRGQYLCADGNRYGDWIRHNLDKPDAYYYKGAFMDAVRAIDVLEQLPETDRGHIFAEGGSQGGALTLAAAALGDGRLRAIAPYIPFLSDYRDYFHIVGWPAGPVKEEAARLGLSDEQLYTNLSYFDIKNFARMITCPVLMGIGLQDPTCPPHTNLSSYNLITSPKEFHIYPTCGHTVDYADWNPRRDAFFARWW